MAVGLFVALAAISIPGGTTLIQTSGYDTAGRGHALLVEDTTLNDAAVAAHPRARGKSANGRYWRLSHEQILNPFHFGATGKGAINVDDGPAFAAADAYFATIATDPSTGGYYTGSLPFSVVGDFFLNTTTLEPRYLADWIGAGAGHFWGGGASSRVRWADGVHGIIPQGPNTTGINTVSGPTLQGCPVFRASKIRFEGGYSGNQANEGLWHAIVPRVPYYLDDCYFYGWSGTGLRSWAGNVTGFANVGGNVSESVVNRCKFENCYVGRDNRGSDANVMRGFGNAYYQCRLQGYVDDNGAGANVEIDPHFAFNGRLNNPNYWTQTATGGYRYALAVGGNKNNAPSGGPTSTADWIFIEAGAAIANDIPTYNAALDFRLGGDCLTLNSAGCHFIQYYSESGGGFSQFSNNTVIDNGPLRDVDYRGGTRLRPESSGGYVIRGNPSIVYLDGASEMTIFGRDATGIFGYVDITRAGGMTLLGGPGGSISLQVGAFGASTQVALFSTSGMLLPATYGVYVNAKKVIGDRHAGWAPATGTATRTAFDTATVTLPQLAERVKAVIDDLHAGVAGYGPFEA